MQEYYSRHPTRSLYYARPPTDVCLVPLSIFSVGGRSRDDRAALGLMARCGALLLADDAAAVRIMHTLSSRPRCCHILQFISRVQVLEIEAGRRSGQGRSGRRRRLVAETNAFFHLPRRHFFCGASCGKTCCATATLLMLPVLTSAVCPFVA